MFLVKHKFVKILFIYNIRIYEFKLKNYKKIKCFQLVDNFCIKKVSHETM